MPLPAAKISKLALVKGGKFMLPSGANVLLPPQNIGWNYYSQTSDVLNLEFYWSPPPGGADGYLIEFDSMATGYMTFETGDLTFLIESVPLYEEQWTATFESQRGDDRSSKRHESDIGPAAPYP